MGGSILIGRRIHIAPYAMVVGVGGGIFLGDYVGVGAFARIYSHSEAPIDGKRMSGPMIPESMKGMITAPVRIERDGLIGTGAVVLPGVTVGEGAVVAANSLVLANTVIRPWTIYGGVPAKLARPSQEGHRSGYLAESVVMSAAVPECTFAVHVDCDNLWIYETEFGIPLSDHQDLIYTQALPALLDDVRALEHSRHVLHHWQRAAASELRRILPVSRGAWASAGQS